jgi:hypothetical protein
MKVMDCVGGAVGWSVCGGQSPSTGTAHDLVIADAPAQPAASD